MTGVAEKGLPSWEANFISYCSRPKQKNTKTRKFLPQGAQSGRRRKKNIAEEMADLFWILNTGMGIIALRSKPTKSEKQISNAKSFLGRLFMMHVITNF